MLCRLILLAMCGLSVGAMRAYDCAHSDARHIPLDTTAPPECADDSSDFLPKEEQHAQLIRTNGAKVVRAAHCHVSYSTRVYGCHGMSHFSSASSYTSFKVVSDMKPQVCWAAVRQQLFSFDRLESQPVHTPRNVWRHAKGFTQGKYRAGGHCDEHATFVSGGEIHQDSMEETFGDVKLQFVTGVYDAATKEIVFNNGVRAPASDRRSFDAYSGVLEWDWDETDEDDACDRLNEIQQGPFTVYAKVNASLLEGAVVVTSLKERDQTQRLGVQLGNRVRTCERTCYEVTSLPDYRFCPFDEDGQPIFPKARYDQEQVVADWDRYKMEHSMIRGDHQFLSLTLRGKEEVRELRSQICEVQRRILWNKLQAISGTRNPHALVDVYGPGYQLTPAGPSVAYLTKCVPFEVTLASFPNCTAEVPVTYMGHVNGTTFFMDSITHVLKMYPEIIRCSDLLPPMYKFNGEWLVANPAPVVSKVIPQPLPQSLLTGNKMVDDFTQDLKVGGLLEYKQVLDVRARLAEVDARDAVLTRATSVATQDLPHRTQGAPLGSLLSDNDYQQLQEWGSIPWLFEKVGAYFYFVFTLTACFSLILTFVRGAVALHADFTLYGWDGGKTLLRAIPHLLGVVTLPLNMVKAVVTAHGMNADRFPGRQLARLAGRNDQPNNDSRGGDDNSEAGPGQGEAPQVKPTAPVVHEPPQRPPAYARLALALDGLP